jgi:glycine/D-amino acid oxidase-like deaminating enzyme
MKSVIIVGAGIIGLWCAVRLAKAGARVTVIEAESEDVIYGGPMASASAAGMLSPFGDAPSPHDALALASYALWRESAPGTMWSDGVRFDGAVFVGDEAVLARAKAAGRPVSVLNASQFRKRTGLGAKLDTAIFVEDEGAADPVRVLTGLLMDARAHGVLIHNNTDVLEASATHVRTHDGHDLEADHVLLAPGAWSIDALIAKAPALKQVRAGKGVLVQVELTNELRPNLHAPDFYICERRGDIVLGATLEFDRTDRRVDPAHVESLLAAAEKLLPGEVRPTGRAWAGIRPMSPDGWPMIGPSSGGLMLAAGHSRNGWLLAPITAEIIASYVFGDEISPAWAALSPQRFETQ